jgi:hypothetical protein
MVNRTFFVTAAVVLLAANNATAQQPTSATAADRLIDARARAYTAAFQNDAAGLREAIEKLEPLTEDQTVGHRALYYAGWAEWAISWTDFQEKRMGDALATSDRAAGYARRALERGDSDPEVMNLLINAMITSSVLDPARMKTQAKEITDLRRKVLELAPTNPRVVMMDAGMIYNRPPEYGGSREKGLQRFLEAIALFDAEAKTPNPDPLYPAWGRELAYGWLPELYLGLEPPQIDKAREAAKRALMMRPDFWYVKEQVLPKLRP